MNSIKIRKQSGSSLIEILVAVFIVSIGLLGVARMELFAKQSSFEAVQRTTASMIVHDMMAKIRANPSNLDSYTGTTVGDETLATPSMTCNSTDCTSAEIATWDIYEWEQMLIGSSEKAGSTNTGGLANPRGCITSTASSGQAGEYTVAVAWRGNAALTNATSTTCGNGANLYGTNEVYRRVITVTFYVSDDGVI